jgi:hypothetical protein
LLRGGELMLAYGEMAAGIVAKRERLRTTPEIVITGL